MNDERNGRDQRVESNVVTIPVNHIRDYLWECDCGSSIFYIICDGTIRCVGCEEDIEDKRHFDPTMEE